MAGRENLMFLFTRKDQDVCWEVVTTISAIYSIDMVHAIVVDYPPAHTANTPFYCHPWLDRAESLMLSAPLADISRKHTGTTH